MRRDATRALLLAMGLAAVGALAGSTVRADAPAGGADTTTTVANPDLNGYWKLDPARSTVPRTPEQMAELRAARDRRDARRRGGRGAGRPPRGPRDLPQPRPGARPGVGRLPDLMHVTHTSTLVSFEDSTGAVVQEVVTTPGADSSSSAPGAVRLSGTWSAGRLAVERPAWRGGTVSESIRLQDAQTLVVEVHAETDGSMPAREFKRVYQKVTEW